MFFGPAYFCWNYPTDRLYLGMNHMKKSIQLVVLGLALSCAVLAQAAKPVFLITPVTKAPSTIYAGQIITTAYTVTNTTP